MSIPAGATHVVADIYSLRDEQKVMNNKYPYRKKDGDLWLAFVDDEWVNVFFPDPSRYQKINKPWSGPEDGLPPVGFRCEAGIPHTSGPDNEVSIIWIEGSVIAYYEIKGSTYAWFAEDDGFYPPAALEFRAIKTPEQIAAEKRESAIRELMDIAQVDCRVTAARLVDAGFKREVV